MDNKYIYALDLAMGNSGIAVYNINECKIEVITSCKTNPKLSHGERLHVQREYILDIMNKYPPYEVVIEQGFSLHNKSTQVIFKVHGVYNEVLSAYPQTYYTPKDVKKQITGNGNAKKEKVKECLLEYYPEIIGDYTMNNDDESDAVAVLITHLKKEYPSLL